MKINRFMAQIYNNWLVDIRRLWHRDRISFIGGSIIIVVLIGLWMLPSADKKIDTAAEEVMSLADNVRKNYQTKPSYWGLDTESAIAAGIVPQKMLRKGKIVNALGKNVLLGMGENGESVMPGASGFEIIYQDIAQNVCSALLTYQFSEQQNLGLKEISVINENKITFSWGGDNPLPVDPMQAKKVCKGKSSIIWSFE